VQLEPDRVVRVEIVGDATMITRQGLFECRREPTLIGSEAVEPFRRFGTQFLRRVIDPDEPLQHRGVIVGVGVVVQDRRVSDLRYLPITTDLKRTGFSRRNRS